MNYIYGNTLVLGDSSYLEHHGIKNQKWGVRRFQNPDGSLTAAGRIRYGVTGAAKAAFKVGKKLGSATASAARASVKKAKDDAYAKKKEKASQTREGVLKNKKMFTNEELKKLEERFKIEDDMRNAGLRHGQEVAKTVSQYANTTKDMLSALQTGGNAVSAITKAFADIQSYKNAKGVAEAAKEKGMTTKEFDLFLKEKYPNANKDGGGKKKGKNSDTDKRSDPEDDGDDDNPPNNGGGGSKKQAKADAKQARKDQAAATEKKASDNANKEIDDIKADTAKKAADISSKYDSPKKDGPKGPPEHTPAPKAKENEELSRIIKDVASKLDSGRMVLGRDKQAESGASNTPKFPGPTIKDHFNADSPAFKQLSAAISAANANKPGAKKPKSNEELSKSLNELTKMAAKNLDTAKDKKSDPSSTNSKILEKNKKTLESALGDVFNGRQNRSANKSKIELLDKKAKGTKDPKMRSKYLKDLANELTLLDEDDFEKYLNNTLLKHSALSSDELAHYGVLGMKWGKHIMAGKGLLPKLESSGGGGGGAPEEDDETIAEKLGIDVDEYREKMKNSPFGSEGSLKKYQEAADAYAKDAEKYMQQANANRIMADGARRAGNQKKAAEFDKAAKDADKKAKRAQANQKTMQWKANGGTIGGEVKTTINKAKNDTRRVLNTVKDTVEYTAGSVNPANYEISIKRKRRTKHDAFEIQNGVLIYGSGQSGELKHFGIKGMKWGVRRFQNKDGTRTAAGKKRYAEVGSFKFEDSTGRTQKRYYARIENNGRRQSGGDHIGTTKRQAKAEAAAEVLSDEIEGYTPKLSDRDRKAYNADIKRAGKEIDAANRYAYREMAKNERWVKSAIPKANRTGDMSKFLRRAAKSQRDADYFNRYSIGDYKHEKSIERKSFAGEIAGSAVVGAGAGIASAISGPIGIGVAASGIAIRTGSVIVGNIAKNRYRDQSLRQNKTRQDEYYARDRLDKVRAEKAKKDTKEDLSDLKEMERQEAKEALKTGINDDGYRLTKEQRKYYKSVLKR